MSQTRLNRAQSVGLPGLSGPLWVFKCPGQARQPYRITPLSALLIFAMLCSLTWFAPQVSAASEPSPVDLAQVPVPASEYIESGFQLLQAGYVHDEGVQSFLGGGEPVREREWEPFDGAILRAYTTVQGLLSDRGDANAEPLALVETAVIELADAADTDEVVESTLAIMGAEDPDESDGVWLYEDQQGIVGVQLNEQWLIVVHYDFSAQQNALQQNTDWTTSEIEDLLQSTSDRLDTAIAASDADEPPLGLAALLVEGPQAGWSQPWPNFPTTQHYRVLDGELVPYAGELRADLRDAKPEGAIELFQSRQVFDDERYGYVFDVTLARFETESDAKAFADAPTGVNFPETWTFEPTYSHLEDDGRFRTEDAQVNDGTLRATGKRSIVRDGAFVQVVQMLASGDGVVSGDALEAFTTAQTTCVERLPDLCQSLAQEDLPIAFSPGESATPIVEGGVIASSQYGWSVKLPDDGWTITTAMIEANVEFYEVQSGRSLMSIESAPDQHGDPQQCILQNLALFEEFESRSDIRLGSPDPKERKAGKEAGHAWAIYTVEPLQEERSDQEYVIRFDCYALVPGQASLVVTHTAPVDLWESEREKGQRFRDAIVLPGEQLRYDNTLPEGDRRETGRTQAMINSRIWIPLAA